MENNTKKIKTTENHCAFSFVFAIYVCLSLFSIKKETIKQDLA